MLKDIILKRRTTRAYKEDKVDRELILDILKHSLMGPSYANAHPVNFVLIEDKDSLKKLSEIEKFGTRYIADVPCGVLVMADTEITKVWVEECSIVASYLGLLAQEAGLNTSWVDLKEGNTQKGVEIQTYLRDEFNIPENFKTLCFIPIGYGNERHKKRGDFDISDKVHIEKF